MADYPYFPLYVEDFAMGTAAMTPTAVGIYARCLCHQWAHGFVPNDRISIARLSGALPDEVNAAWDSLSQKLKETSPGRLQNARLERERAAMLEKIERRSTAGKAGAEARWGNGNRNATALANAMPTQCGRNGKTMARAFDSDSDSIQGSISNGTQSSSSPLPPRQATPSVDPEWAEAEAALFEEGLLKAGEVIGTARARACTPAKVFEVIEHFRSNKPAWGPGALGERISRLRMHQAANELWPEPATAPTSKAPGKSREAHQAELDRKRSEAETMAAAEAARLAELELRHGPELNSKSREWIRTATFERSPESAELMLRGLPAKGPPGPGMLRLELLEYLASKDQPP